MTTTVDREHRAVTPFQPGDVIEVEQQSPDIAVLKRRKHAQIAQPRLERKNGRLIFVGEALATDDVKRLIEDFRDPARRQSAGCLHLGKPPTEGCG